LEEAERRVNEIILDDRPIAVRYGTAGELAAQGIRKKVDREGTLRVIDIDGFDRQPCGGTHLARTGQTGMLLTRKCERQKGNWRAEFVAGWRALAAARADWAVLRQAAEHLGCGMAELPENLRKLQEERRASQRDAKRLTERLAELEAADLLARHAETSHDGKRRIIVSVSDDAASSYLAILAAKIVAIPNMRVILASRAATAIVLAQSAGLDGDMGALLRELLAPVGGKGGGSKVFAQGTVPEISALDGVVNAARARF
ncbi:MAG: DHHA1 domain-containing protein, partial [Candidatus Acidiferrales bacterium]